MAMTRGQPAAAGGARGRARPPPGPAGGSSAARRAAATPAGRLPMTGFIYVACQLPTAACGGERAQRARGPRVECDGTFSIGGDVITGGPHLFADECRRMVDTRQESCLHAIEHSGPQQRASAPKRSTQTSPTAQTCGHVPPFSQASDCSVASLFRPGFWRAALADGARNGAVGCSAVEMVNKPPQATALSLHRGAARQGRRNLSGWFQIQ
jgi:hypothetical protein